MKLTEENIEYFILDNIPYVGIREDEFDGDIYKVKQQILENQEIVERLREKFTELKNHPNYEVTHGVDNICLHCGVLTLQSILGEKA